MSVHCSVTACVLGDSSQASLTCRRLCGATHMQAVSGCVRILLRCRPSVSIHCAVLMHMHTVRIMCRHSRKRCAASRTQSGKGPGTQPTAGRLAIYSCRCKGVQCSQRCDSYSLNLLAEVMLQSSTSRINFVKQDQSRRVLLSPSSQSDEALLARQAV